MRRTLSTNRTGRMRRIGASLVAALLLTASSTAPAAAKGLDTMGALGGLTQPGSPYRYQALTPTHTKAGGRWTIIERTARHGGKISRWWRLGGSWLLPAVSYD